MTAIHSASASLLAKRQGKEDTVRLLKSQTRALLQKIDMDSKMKKMAELQLSIVSDPKNRKAIENQVRRRISGCYSDLCCGVTGKYWLVSLKETCFGCCFNVLFRLFGWESSSPKNT